MSPRGPLDEVTSMNDGGGTQTARRVLIASALVSLLVAPLQAHPAAAEPGSGVDANPTQQGVSGSEYTITALGPGVGGVDDYLSVAGINRRAQAVGTVGDPEQLWTRVWVWDPRDGLRYLRLRGGALHAVDNNDSGQVLVWTNDDRVFVWHRRTGRRYLPAPRGWAWADEGAVAINDLGQVVGHVVRDGRGRAVLWDPEEGYRILPPLRVESRRSRNCYPAALNRSGLVVGDCWFSDPGGSRAFRWDPRTGTKDLGTLGSSDGGKPFVRVHAYDINDSGRVVGESFLTENSWHAFVWTPRRGMIDLGTLGGDRSHALAISSSSLVMGSSERTALPPGGFVWTPGGLMVDIGALGEGSVDPRALNDAGQVVGGSQVDPGLSVRRPFVWDALHGITDLGTQPGHIGASARDINERGQVVGVADLADEGRAVVLWSPRVTIGVKAVRDRTRLRLNVNPDLGADAWRVTIQRKRPDGTWARVGTHLTRGTAETRTLDLPRGTYRVVVRAQKGFTRATSEEVRLRR